MSGEVSTSKFPSGSPSASEQRVRWFFGFGLTQTVHPQPIVGTPTEVPDPRIINSPRISEVWKDWGTANVRSRWSHFHGPAYANRRRGHKTAVDHLAKSL